MTHTIIAPQHYHEEFKRELLQNKKHLLNIMVRDFDFVFFSPQTSARELELDIFHALTTIETSTLSSIIGFPKTVDMLINFSKELLLYNIDPNDLPQNTPLQRDIYACVLVVLEYLSKPEVPQGTFTIYENGLSYAQKSFLRLNNLPTVETPARAPQSIRYRVALNLRTEIEATIQDILLQKLDNAVVAMPNLDAALPLIESILPRYGVSYHFYDDDQDLVSKHFRALFEFSLNPSTETLINVLKSNALNFYNFESYLLLIDHFKLELSDILSDFPVLDESWPRDLYRHYINVTENLEAFQTVLQTLAAPSIDDAMIVAYNTLCNIYPMRNLTPLKSLITQSLTLYTENTLPFFYRYVENLKSANTKLNTIQFVDMRQLPLQPVENLYILNLTAKTFPATSSHTGIIDESYLNKVCEYPTLDKRTQDTLSQQMRIFNISDNLTLSFASSTYEGKSIEPSYPVDTFCKQNNVSLLPWRIQQVLSRKQTVHRLSPEIANTLFLDDGRIRGSISSFQLYTQDPYQFFIERGLKLKKPEPFALNPLILGTFNHAVMESLHIDKDVQDLHVIKNSFSPRDLKSQLIFKRNDDMMTRNINFVLNSIDSSKFEPSMSEKHFEDSSLFPSITLKGIIDRIDVNNDNILIVDYKSSAQSLAQKKVQSGEQLQLLTYAMIGHRKFNKDVLGVFYFGFTDKNNKISRRDFKPASGVVTLEHDPEEAWKQNKRYSGWYFQSPDDSFENVEYYGGLRQLKSGEISTFRKPYDFIKVSNLLTDVYAQITTQILNGVIDADRLDFEIDPNLNLKQGDDTNDSI